MLPAAFRRLGKQINKRDTKEERSTWLHACRGFLHLIMFLFAHVLLLLE